MQCETPEQLVELAKSKGVELTLDEAQAYLDEIDDIELDSKKIKTVARDYVGIYVKFLLVSIKILHSANYTRKEKYTVLYLQ